MKDNLFWRIFNICFAMSELQQPQKPVVCSQLLMKAACPPENSITFYSPPPRSCIYVTFMQKCSITCIHPRTPPRTYVMQTRLFWFLCVQQACPKSGLWVIGATSHKIIDMRPPQHFLGWFLMISYPDFSYLSMIYNDFYNNVINMYFICTLCTWKNCTVISLHM